MRAHGITRKRGGSGPKGGRCVAALRRLQREVDRFVGATEGARCQRQRTPRHIIDLRASLQFRIHRLCAPRVTAFQVRQRQQLQEEGMPPELGHRLACGGNGTMSDI